MREMIEKLNALVFVSMASLALVLISGYVHAANTADPGYRLGPDDIVQISIMAGGEEQVSKDVVVGSGGYITVPFVGKVKVAGLTVAQVEKIIHPPLESDYFVDPQVHIQVKEYHSLQFFVSGAVGSPGMYELDFNPRIMDLVANAGGVLPERGNLAYILRGVNQKNLSDEKLKSTIASTKPIKINLVKLLDKGDMTENIRLKSGDTLYIPLGTKLNQAATKVYVQGKVKSPGIFNYQPGMTALGACIQAGGFDKFSAPNRAKIIRQTSQGQETIKINLEKVEKGQISDPQLQPGDRIHIPESWL